MLTPRVLLLLMLPASLAAASATSFPGKPPAAIRHVFEENRGQADALYSFLLRGGGYSAAVAAAETRYGLRSGQTITVRAVGGRHGAAVRGLDPKPGKVNYLTSSWRRTGIATFGKVRVDALYPGIDMEMSVDDAGLEYDFVLEPNADPARIELEFNGAASLRVDEAGDLVIEGAHGEALLRHRRPIAYQPVQGTDKSRTVPCRFVVGQGRRVSFELGDYDRSRPLVIDPVVFTASTFGGGGADTPFAMEVDSAGNLYVAGSTDSQNFPTMGAIQGTNGGNLDAFVMKLDPTAQTVLFATYLGGGNEDQAFGLQLDGAGNPWVAGLTRSENFPVTTGALQAQYGGGESDGFLVKLNAAGNQLLYATFVGGNAFDSARAVDLDGAGNVYVAGGTDSDNFVVTSGAYRTTRVSREAFVRKLNPGATALLYSTFFGGGADDFANGLAVTAAGVAFVAGSTFSNNLPATQVQTNEVQTTHGGDRDAFLAAISADGSTLEFCTYIGGTGVDNAFGVDVSPEGATVAVAGSTASATLPGATTSYNGGNDGFLATFELVAETADAAAGFAMEPLLASEHQTTARLRRRAIRARRHHCCGPGFDQLIRVRVLRRGIFATGHAGPFSTIGDLFGGATAASNHVILRADENGVVTDRGSAGPAVNGQAIVVTKDNRIIACGTNAAGNQVQFLVGTLPAGVPLYSGLGNGGIASDPIATATGEYFSEAADVNLGGLPGLSFVRYYSTLLASVTSGLGRGWMHNFDQRIAVTGDYATVTLFSGKTVEFDRSGSAWRLAGEEQLDYQLAETADRYQFLDPRTSLVHSFTKPGGVLVRIEDRNGNGLTVTQGASGPTEVTDGAGRTLRFTYSGGQLTGIADQTQRSWTFAYQGGNLATVTDPNAAVTTYEYNSTGLMEVERRPEANTLVRNSYDGNSRAVAQEDGLAGRTGFEFSESGTTIRDARGNATRHVHAGQRNITSATDAVGNAVVLEYDSANRRTVVRDRLGHTITTRYNASGRPTALVHSDSVKEVARFTWTAQTQGPFVHQVPTRLDAADDSSIAWTYDDRGNVISRTDQAGQKTTYTYDVRGRRLTITNPAGGVTTRTYNADNTLATERSPAGDTTTFQYDTLLRTSRITIADGTFQTFEYDALDRVTRRRDARGSVTSFAYDRNGRLISTTDPLGKTTRFTYDNSDRLATTTDREGRLSRLNYDSTNNLTGSVNALNEATSYTVDALNRRTATSDATGKTVRTTYNAEGRPASWIDALNRTWRQSTDARGRVTRLTSPAGGNLDIAYNAVSLPVSLRDPLNQTVDLSYDPRRVLASMRLSGDLEVRYSRNALGQISSIRDPNGGEWKLEFDNQGRLTTSTDPRGRATRYTYDARNRVRQTVSPVGTVDFTYDGAGNVTREAHSDGVSHEYTYDGAGRLTGGTGVTLAYNGEGEITTSNGLALERDALGRISSIAYAAGKTVRYAYNARGDLIRVTDWVGGATEFSYNDARQLTAITRPNGRVSRFSFDADARVSEIAHEGFGAVRLTRDAAGKISSFENTMPGAATPSGRTDAFTFDSAHQVVEAEYDSDGRLTARGADRYTWSLAGRLISYVRAGTQVANTYDAFGLRLSRGGRQFVWNYATGLPSIAIVRSGTTDIRYYVVTPHGEVLHSIEASGNARRYYHYDQTGSTLLLSGDSGAATDTYRYGPYGEPFGRTGESDNPFTFSGRFGVMDEGDGLYSVRLRYLDSQTGRFLSKDPIRHLSPREVNPYGYAAADPVNLTDVDGAEVIADPSVKRLLISHVVDVHGRILNTQTSFDATIPPLGLPAPREQQRPMSLFQIWTPAKYMLDAEVEGDLPVATPLEVIRLKTLAIQNVWARSQLPVRSLTQDFEKNTEAVGGSAPFEVTIFSIGLGGLQADKPLDAGGIEPATGSTVRKQ